MSKHIVKENVKSDTINDIYEWYLQENEGGIEIICNECHVLRINSDGTFIRYSFSENLGLPQDTSLKLIEFMYGYVK